MKAYQSTDPIAQPMKVIEFPMTRPSMCSSSICNGLDLNSGCSTVPLRKMGRRSFRKSSSSLSHSFTLRQNLATSPTRVQSTRSRQLSPEPPRSKKGMPPRCKSDGSGTTAKTALSTSTKTFPGRRHKPNLKGESATVPKQTQFSKKGKKSLRSASMSNIAFPEDDFGRRSVRTSDIMRLFVDETLQVNNDDRWNCSCGHQAEGRMKFCGLCGLKKHLICAGCAFDENKCMYVFCGMCGISR